MPFYSKNLNRILDASRDNLGEEVRLADLANDIINRYGDNTPMLAMLLAKVNGIAKRGEIDLILLEMIKHDSAVRDILTTGHLAKLISRLEYFHRTGDYRIIGMPNILFDHLSQTDRMLFFENGNILETEGELLNNPDVQIMLEQETKLLSGTC